MNLEDETTLRLAECYSENNLLPNVRETNEPIVELRKEVLRPVDINGALAM